MTSPRSWTAFCKSSSSDEIFFLLSSSESDEFHPVDPFLILPFMIDLDRMSVLISYWSVGRTLWLVEVSEDFWASMGSDWSVGYYASQVYVFAWEDLGHVVFYWPITGGCVLSHVSCSIFCCSLSNSLSQV
jgi:hypothetical protein